MKAFQSGWEAKEFLISKIVVVNPIRQSAMVFCALVVVCVQGNAAQDRQQAHMNKQILVESFVISGTQSIDTAELTEITGSMSGSQFNDDAEELRERIRGQFQDRGYFNAEIKQLDIKVIDPLASPKPVRLEAQVSDGPRCRLSTIEFNGNHAFSSQDLTAKIPVKAGDEFAVSKIRGGLQSVRDLYNSHGFLDAVSVPDAKLDSSSSLKLTIRIHEGIQYRMGEFEVSGPSDIAEKIKMRWELAPGAIFDEDYLRTFLEKNASLLPENSGDELFPDCRDATVSVHLHLSQDPKHAALDRNHHVDCPRSDANKEK